MDKILLPNSLIFGGGTLKEIINLLDSLGKTKPFIITDNNMVKLNIYYSKETMKVYYKNIDNRKKKNNHY